MMKGDTRDIVGGALVMAIGAAFAWSASFFPMGSGRVLGPGYFPIAAGAIAFGLGLWIFVTGLFRSGRIGRIAFRPLIAVMASIAAFGLLLQRIGLIPTLIIVVVIGALGSTATRPLPVALLALGLSVSCWLIFVKGLGLNMPVFRSPL